MIIAVMVNHPLHVPLGPAHVLLCEAAPGPLQPALDVQTAAIAMGAPLEGNYIAGIGVAVCGWSALLERCSECCELAQGLWPSVFCPLCSRCLAACPFLLLMTSERQSTLRSLLPFLFCLCAHLCVLCSFPGPAVHCTLSAGCSKPPLTSPEMEYDARSSRRGWSGFQFTSRCCSSSKRVGWETLPRFPALVSMFSTALPVVPSPVSSIFGCLSPEISGHVLIPFEHEIWLHSPYRIGSFGSADYPDGGRRNHLRGNT